MTRNSSKCLAVIVAVVALVIATVAPAAAQSDKEQKDEPKAKARSAEETTTVHDVSGLTVTRTWTIAKKDPSTLVTLITAQNTTPAPITTSVVEPIPTTSLKRITFKPLTMPTSSIPGLGRFAVTVPPGGSLRFGYTARLVPDRKAKAQDRLATVKREMEATLPGAQATEADRALAAMKDRYAGPVEVTDASITGLDGDTPARGPVGTNILRLTATPPCYVVSRGCRFAAQDSSAREPRLTALEPSGIALVATGSADVAESGLTCAGAEEPAVVTRHWNFEPTAWRLTWAGWEVVHGRYTVVLDMTAEETGRCVAASVHTVTTGVLTADAGPTIRG